MIAFNIRSVYDIGETQSGFQLDASPDVFVEEYINDMPPLTLFNPYSALSNIRSTMILTMSFTVSDIVGIDISGWMLQMFDAMIKKPNDSIIAIEFFNSRGDSYRKLLAKSLLDYGVSSSNKVDLVFSILSEVTYDEH